MGEPGRPPGLRALSAASPRADTLRAGETATRVAHTHENQVRFLGPLRMALRAKVRGRWRVVSKAMARVFARRGIEVVDTEALAAAVAQREAAARSRPEIKARAVVRPTPVDVALTPEPAAVVFRVTPGERVSVTPPGAPAPPAPEIATISALLDASLGRQGIDVADDLTDDELERLTAPDKE